jgi:hypothetical protein
MQKYIFYDQIENNWKKIFANIYGNKYINTEFPSELNDMILIIDSLPNENDRHIYYNPNGNYSHINIMNSILNNNHGLLIFYRFLHCNTIHYKFINHARIENYSPKYNTYKLCFTYLSKDNKINIMKKQLKNLN